MGAELRVGVRGESWDSISSDNRESKPISLDLPLAWLGSLSPQMG